MTNYFYLFLGLHSFLIGLFPFYIPVYLFANGFLLGDICMFIGLTGVGFCCCLYIWDRVAKRVAIPHLIAFSYFSELVLLTLFFLEKNIYFLVVTAFFNGVFNCNFWIIQRLLFLETITPENSGKKFGNFQIFVLVVLKSAIFAGGLLLERSGFLALYLVSMLIVVCSVLYFQRAVKRPKLSSPWPSSPPLPLLKVVRYRDNHGSIWVFLVDGIFLYLESYFWVISLYLLVNESFSRLGIIVIILAVIFSLMFILIKNSIDRIAVDTFYIIAVLLYAFSWVLRAMISNSYFLDVQLIILAVITFCTSIFRLAFNKRFFDIAHGPTAHEYIFVKSYSSQGFLLLFLLLPFLPGWSEGVPEPNLARTYFFAAVLSAVFLVYRSKRGREQELERK